MIQEDPALQSAWGQPSTSVKASVRIATETPAPATSGKTSQTSLHWDESCAIELHLTILARPLPDHAANVYKAVIIFRGTAFDPDLKKRLRALRRQLAFHLNDTQWSLDAFFRDHCLTVSSTERLVFQDYHEFEQWLAASTDTEAEDRIRRMSTSWMRSGVPQSQLGGNTATRRAVGEWLVQLQEPTNESRTSITGERTTDLPRGPHPSTIANTSEGPDTHTHHGLAQVTLTFPA